MNLPLNMSDAYAMRTEGRWWIVHSTPAGLIVRLLTSYPDKPAALRAIEMLGYRAVDPPKPLKTPKVPDGDAVLAAFQKWFNLPRDQAGSRSPPLKGTTKE